MSLPYQNATTGKAALEDIQKVLKAFGCNKFATGEDFETGEVFVQFERRGKMFTVNASAKGYAAAWLNANEYNNRRKGTRIQHEAKALEIGSIAVYSILRDQIKCNVTAVEIGIMSFEAAFLAHIMLPNGKRVIEEVQAQKLLGASSE